jgi:hypothetical protein
MAAIVFNGCLKDAKRISFTNLLQDKLNLKLKDAKLTMDRIIENEEVKIANIDVNIADEILEGANKFGFIAFIT